jgi:uncharacterized protein (TIGR02145 family)
VKVTNNGINDTRWRVPTKADWEALVVYAGGVHFPTVNYSSVGGKLKAIGTTHWTSPNTGATDEYGFKALPSGRRGIFGSYTSLREMVDIWDSEANLYNIHYTSSNINRNAFNKRTGAAVRIVRTLST